MGTDLVPSEDTNGDTNENSFQGTVQLAIQQPNDKKIFLTANQVSISLHQTTPSGMYHDSILRTRKISNNWPDIKEANEMSSQLVTTAFKHRSKKRDQNSCCKKIWKHFQYFFDGTSLHGLKYVGAREVTLPERIFWLLAFIIAVATATVFISDFYDRWKSSPVIVAINPENKAISKIPFPAITICNMNQAKKSIAYNIYEYDERLLLEDFCNAKNSSSITNLTDNPFPWPVIKKFMKKVSQPCSDLFIYCQWTNVDKNCSDIIHTTLTDDGVCCTFNRVHSKFMYFAPSIMEDFNSTYLPGEIDWTPESGYPENKTAESWPWAPLGAGAHLGVSFGLDVDTQEYYCSSTNSVGLKVRLHNPVENPKMADFGFFVHPRKEVRVVINPTIEEAVEDLTEVPIDKRQCLFQSERQLVFYRTYTKQNCEFECEANYTMSICKCVPYYLPKNETTPVCGKKKEECYKKAKTYVDTTGYTSNVCDCLPACYEIKYFQDHSIGDLSKTDVIDEKYLKRTRNVNDLIIIHVYFSISSIRIYEKRDMFGFTDFLAYTGGILGLFLGFSFLSLVEIIYHLTLRVWCSWCQSFRKREIKEDTAVYPFAK